MKLDEIKDLTNKYILDTYKRYEVSFKYGINELLFDSENRQYIDFFSGVAVTNLGHSDPDIIEAIHTQSDQIIHTSNHFYSEPAALLAETLIVNSFPGKVFFANSGTEANEAALKLMRKYAHFREIEDPIILALENSFHGRSYGALSLTGQDSLKTGLGKLVPDIEFIPPNDTQTLGDLVDEFGSRIAGIIVEPILGESGVIPLTSSFLKLIREVSLEREFLFILDEIQTGIGRTGTLFSFEHFDIIPDAITLAKGLGSGFPIGALIVADQYSHLLGKGEHGSTFGGNPLSCRVAYETIRSILSRDLLSHVQNIADIFRNRLVQFHNRFPFIKDVRGLGLLMGIELEFPSREIVEKCLSRGLVVNSTGGNVIRLAPPLSISEFYTHEGLNILEKVLEEV